MADTKISALTAVTVPVYTDEYAVNQGGTSKKATLAQVQGGYVAAVATGNTGAQNTTAIHAARDAAGTNGTVLIPAGAYTVNALSANVAGQVWAIAAGCTLTLAAAQNTDALAVSAAGVTIRGENWTSIIDQGTAGQSGGSGIYVTGADRVTIRDLKVQNVKNRGINVTNSDELMVDRVWVTATGTDGIFIEGNSGSNNCTVQNSKVTAGPASGDADCISAHGNAAAGTIHGFRALDNYLEPNGTGQFGIEVGAFSGTDPQERVIIRGNVIVATAASFGGISLDGCEGAVVEGNTFDANGQTCDIAGIELASCEECSIVGNRIIGDTTLAMGVSVDRSSRNTITGNTIQGWSNTANKAGLGLHTAQASQHVRDNVVTGNVFIHPASTVTNAAVLLYANGTGLLVERNIISGNSLVGGGVASSVGVKLDRASAGNGTVQHNTITGNTFYNLTDGIFLSTSDTPDNRLAPNRFVTVTNPFDASDTWDMVDQARTIQFVIDGGGSAITTGVKGDIELPFSGYILAATTLADQSGSIVIDLWRDTYANFPPTVADTITASAKPTLSAATKAQDGTLTGWSRSFTKGDVLRVNVDSASTLTRVTISLLALEL